MTICVAVPLLDSKVINKIFFVSTTRRLQNVYFLNSLVTMHRPDEIPMVSKEWFRVPMHQESFVSITPRVTLTADSLKRYDAER